MKMIRLRGPSVADDAELNIAGVRYTIHPDGHFYVPEGVAIEGALRVGGFVLAPLPQHSPAIEAAVESLAAELRDHPEIVAEVAEKLKLAAAQS